MIRTVVFELPADEFPNSDEGVVQFLVDLYPDDSITLASRPDRYSTWGRPYDPVRDETSGEPTTVHFANYIEAAAQWQAREDIEERLRDA